MQTMVFICVIKDIMIVEMNDKGVYTINGLQSLRRTHPND